MSVNSFCKFILIFFLTVNSAYAIEETPVILDEFEHLNIENSNLEIPIDKVVEKTVLGKIFKNTEAHAVYIGNFAFTDVTHSSDNTFKYNASVLDLWIEGDILDKKNHYVVRINPLRNLEGYTYLTSMISDYYIERKITENNKVRIGQSRTPIGLEGGTSQYILPFATRAQISRNYGNVRTYGIRNIGMYKYFDYDIGLYDSTRYLQKPFRGAEFVGLIQAKPLAKFEDKRMGKFIIGGSMNTGKKENDLTYLVTGAFAQYEYKKFFVNAEYAFANGSNGVESSHNKSEGFYTTVAYKLHPKVEVLGRFDTFDPDLTQDRDRINEYSAGVNYYPWKDNLKLSLNYVFRSDEGGVNSNRYILMTQFKI